LELSSWNFSDFYVTSVYLFTKLLFIFNAFFMLITLNYFLETEKYGYYGFGVIVDIFNGTTWENSRVFPRVASCDFKVGLFIQLKSYFNNK